MNTLLRAATAAFAVLTPALGHAQDRRLNRAIDYNPNPRIFETVLFPPILEVSDAAGVLVVLREETVRYPIVLGRAEVDVISR